MSSTWGRNIKLSLFGESHGAGVGVVVDGLLPGFAIDFAELERQMARRAPGKALSTPRKEPDRLEVLSGLRDSVTTGAPVCMFVRNTSQRSADYEALRGVARPGHADYSAHVKYRGFGDMRGSGHFSGRLTAGMVAAGAIARQVLAKKGVFVGSHLLSVGEIEDRPFDPVAVDAATLQALGEMELPALDKAAKEAMGQAIVRAGGEGDSLGGVVECAAVGLCAGWGDPMFGGVESVLSSLLFGIPAVKGVEFGTGFGMGRMRGSKANDPFYLEDGRPRTRSNHNGGINGGITNGMPLIVRVAIKPTSSIFLEQDTVNFLDNREMKLTLSGRHDPCIAPRALVALEAALAIALLDICMEANKWE
ncbi:MAG: chorismate synthase [Christensenellales bacterium]|jgi:chorismate synthase